MTHSTEEFVTLWQTAMANGTFRSLTVADRFRKGGDLPHKQMVRPILLKEQVVYQWELPGEKMQTHLNLSAEESVSRFQEQFGTVYRESYLFTSEEDISARFNKKGVHIKRRPATNDANVAPEPHNRVKKYLIPENVPCAFLQALGVMNVNGNVKKQKEKKFRQINRYLEIVNDVYPQLPKTGVIKVIDFGCGLSYLTFALHHLITVIHGREVEMVGIDRNEDVISRCTKISKGLELQGIRFNAGNIDSSAGQQHVHLAISLHACDTATDHALAYGVSANADVIMAVPCCQHELNNVIDCEQLKPLTRFGIMKERFAAEATDTLRALALEARGYSSQILEFIELEHTPKNLLIRAVKQADKAGYATAYGNFKGYLGVDKLATDLVLEAEVAELIEVAVEEVAIIEEDIAEEVSKAEEVVYEVVTEEVTEAKNVAEEEVVYEATTPVEEVTKAESYSEVIPVDEEETPEVAAVEEPAVSEVPVIEPEVEEEASVEPEIVIEEVDEVEEVAPVEKKLPVDSPWGNRTRK